MRTSTAAMAVVATALALLALTAMVGPASGRTELTYWEDQTGLPSPQQRWYQYMKRQDSGPPVGALGAGWDVVNRDGRFPGDYGYVAAEAPRTTELSELDPLASGSGSSMGAHKYLQQLQAQSVAGQKAYEAKKAAERREAMQKGIKKAQVLYQYTLKHGYGKDLSREYWKTLEALNPGKTS